MSSDVTNPIADRTACIGERLSAELNAEDLNGCGRYLSA